MIEPYDEASISMDDGGAVKKKNENRKLKISNLASCEFFWKMHDSNFDSFMIFLSRILSVHKIN